MLRRAFTLVEMMIVVLVMAIVAAAVLPNATADGTIRLVSAVNMLAADIEYAQSVSLSDPDDPALFRIDEKAEQYWLARASDPETPITKPGGDPYVVTYGQGGDATFPGIDVDLVDEENDVAFDAFGRLAQPGDRTIRLSSPVSGAMRVVVSADTGSVFIKGDDG